MAEAMNGGIGGVFLRRAPAGLAAMLVLGPALTGRGFSLVGDMVFVPRQPWKDAWLGLDGSVPRAVPGDALMSLVTNALPGDLVQKVILLAILVGAGWGVVALCRDLPPVAAAAAGVFAVWNPYVHERLGIGHWALLCGYAAVPWVVLLAARVGRDGLRAVPVLVLPLAAAGWTSPTGGLLTVLVAIVVVGRASLPRAGIVALVGGLVNLPWLLVGVINSVAVADPFGVDAFAARTDTPGGVGVSLATLGGIWKETVHPAERAGFLGLLATVVVVLAVVGIMGALRRRDALLGPLALISIALLTSTWFFSTDPGRPVARWIVTTIPGGGIVRDTQKLIAPWAIVVSVGWGHLVAQVLRLRSDMLKGIAPLAVLVPPLLLPSLVWGLAGTLAPAPYPQEWYHARELLSAAGAADQSSVVLPMSTYRRFSWNDDKAVLDPAPRFFPGRVVTDDSLTVRSGTVEGEDPLAADLRRAERDGTLPEALDHHGIRFVVIERGSTGTAPAPELPPGQVLLRGSELIVVDQGAGVRPQMIDAAPWVWVIDLLTMALVVASATFAAIARIGAARAYTSSE